MPFDEIKEDLGEVKENTQSYIERSVTYYKLKVFKILMRSITALTNLVVLGFVIVLALIFLSFAASVGLGRLLHNEFLGYLIVGGIYLLLAGLFYIKRAHLERSIIKKFSADFFGEDEA